MKPMLKYRGGKSKELPILMPYVPKFKGRYIEPFVGGGAMFFQLEKPNGIINDINKRLMDFYDAVKNNFYSLKRELCEIQNHYISNRVQYETIKKMHPNERIPDGNEEMYYRMRDRYNGLISSEYSQAALYYFMNKTSYSGMIRYNSKGEFNVPYGRYKCFNVSLVTERHHLLLENTEMHSSDYKDIFNLSKTDDFMFLDPPYDCTFSDYGNKEYRGGFNEDDHRKLANDFKNLGCKALMVIGETPLIAELYRDRIVGKYKKDYSVNIRNRFHSNAVHLIITNY